MTLMRKIRENVHFSPPDHARLVAEAERRGETVAEIVRRIVAQYLETKES